MNHKLEDKKIFKFFIKNYFKNFKKLKANEKILKLMNKDNYLFQEEIELFKELMFQCDLKIQNKYVITPLIYAFSYNNIKGLNINEEQWDYLIKNSDLKQQSDNGWTPLMYAFMYNQSENLNLN